MPKLQTTEEKINIFNYVTPKNFYSSEELIKEVKRSWTGSCIVGGGGDCSKEHYWNWSNFNMDYILDVSIILMLSYLNLKMGT